MVDVGVSGSGSFNTSKLTHIKLTHETPREILYARQRTTS
jgi:hypothetical protein